MYRLMRRLNIYFQLRLVGSDGAWFRLKAGEVWRYSSRDLQANDTAAVWAAFINATTIVARSASGAPNLRVIAVDDT